MKISCEWPDYPEWNGVLETKELTIKKHREHFQGKDDAAIQDAFLEHMFVSYTLVDSQVPMDAEAVTSTMPLQLASVLVDAYVAELGKGGGGIFKRMPEEPMVIAPTP